MYCADIIQTNYFLFSSEVPRLLYYSHLPAIILSILLGVWVFFSAKKSSESKIFLILSLLFSSLSLGNLVIWTNSNSTTISIFWILIIESFNWLLFLISYLFYVFVNHHDVKFIIKISIVFLLLISPIIILSKFGISEFDLNSCELIINDTYYLYQLFINLLAVGLIIYTFLKHKRNFTVVDKKKNILFFIAAIIFSVFFLVTWHLSSFLDLFIYEQIGYIGFIIFISLISYLIVKFNAFNIKLLATQALIWGLAVLVGSQLFFIQIITNFILNSVTFVGIIVAGIYLIQSVKKEINQRERLEQLRLKLEESNLKLEDANEKLKGLDKLKTEFVSLASHQLRSPLTAIKGYASMLADGDYGSISTEAKEAIDRIYESSKNLAIVVEDLLNITKIEAGGMKFEMVPFDLSVIVEDEIKDFTLAADKKGLKLNFEKDENNLCTVNGDKEKIRQIVINYIDNSIKYTKEGEVNVSVRNNNGKVVFCVQDTGMGMTKEIKDSLFQKFSRGDGAKMNSTGTGLGLYLAKQIVEAHKGRVWVESDGLGKGSAFFVEMDEAK